MDTTVTTYVAPRTKRELMILVASLEHDVKLLNALNRNLLRDAADAQRKLGHSEAALLTIMRIAAVAP